jgi:hypothetical protein
MWLAIVFAVMLMNMLMFNGTANASEPVIIPPMPNYAPSATVVSEEQEWELYYQDAYYDYAEQFTNLFNSYETKRAKNGALMIRSGNSGSFKFAKKGI